MKLRVGDTVQVIAGSDKGKTGEIIQILRKEDRVVTREAPIHVSNVAYYDSKAKETVKIGYDFDSEGKKFRINKKTGKPL